MIKRWFAGLPEEHQERLRLWGRRGIIACLVLLFVMLGTLALAFDTLAITRNNLELQVGEVAPRDILAPRSLTYPSEVQTDQVRQDAIAKVQPVYDPNPDVTREQIRLAREVTTYINEIRHDIYATTEQQLEDLLLIETLTVGESIWDAAIHLPDTRWDLISNEISALVERTMQRDIRPDNLDVTRSTLVNSVASRFSNNEAEIIVAIVEDLITPNTFFNEELTRRNQEAAAANVPTQDRSFEQGQLIVRSGNIITPLDMEALRQFGFLQREDIQVQALIGALLAMVIATVTLGLYLDRFYPELLRDQRMLMLMAVLFLLSLATINLFGSKGANQPYLYPSAAFGLIVTTLFTPQLAIVATSILAILVGVTQPDDMSLQITAYVLVGSMAGILSLRRVDYLNSYFFAGLVTGLGNLVAVLAFMLSAEEQSSLADGVLRSMLALANGLFAAGIALVGLYVITSLMNLTTNLKLLELMDSKQPLMQQLLREAPGTYQHSLQVANLSEIAAEAVNADAQLIRVAAMYHDIGKMLNPYYFVENTAEGITPHEDLNDPLKSAKVIIGHVIEGERMAKRANLPVRIRDFILEHHGTTQVLYFYNQALEQAGGDESAVDVADFTYPGPAPRSRETAIMMLADGCESATRSRRPSSKADIEEMVNTIFELRLSEGQLDDSGLTLNDLKAIRQVFIETLKAMYHPRIAYKTRRKTQVEEGERNPHTQITSGIVKHLESPQNGQIKTRTGEQPAVKVSDGQRKTQTNEQPTPKPENVDAPVHDPKEEPPVSDAKPDAAQPEPPQKDDSA